jgi:hypothetical protein
MVAHPAGAQNPFFKTPEDLQEAMTTAVKIKQLCSHAYLQSTLVT